jgi:hypothetical protein
MEFVRADKTANIQRMQLRQDLHPIVHVCSRSNSSRCDSTKNATPDFLSKPDSNGECVIVQLELNLCSVVRRSNRHVSNERDHNGNGNQSEWTASWHVASHTCLRQLARCVLSIRQTGLSLLWIENSLSRISRRRLLGSTETRRQSIQSCCIRLGRPVRSWNTCAERVVDLLLLCTPE